nr:PREDICTED: somatomedin-B and thrombospondin type-1 domain-containing protein-like [Bemisia tabaci]
MMTRRRVVVRQPENGGKHCPSLVQKRGCLGSQCPHDPRSALKETAMLLPVSLSLSRKINETSDIRRNLRFRYPKDPAENFNKEYCVLFEVTKAKKACRKEAEFSSLREGERVCVRCESQAMRPALGYRCPGHGTMDRTTRWAALAAPHCHGKWVRLDMGLNALEYDDTSCSACEKGPKFIFV